MWKQAVIFFALLFTLVNASISNRSEVFNVGISIDQRIEAIREKFANYRDAWNVPESEINWNPIETYNKFLVNMCRINVDANYMIPNNCYQFCMCAGGRAFLWTCPAGGMYAPIPDLCSYPTLPNQAKCPWNSIWDYIEGVRCETLGQRLYWGFLTFPKDKDVICGEDIIYCLKFKQVGASKCPAGCGYSRKFLACLRLDLCLSIDLNPSRELEYV